MTHFINTEKHFYDQAAEDADITSIKENLP